MVALFSKLTAVVLFCFCSLSFAQQDFQGKAYYMSKTSMDIDQWTQGREISPEQRKRMEERMKSFLEKEYILTFNKEASIYKEDERLETPGSGSRWGGFGSSFSAGPKYKNVKSKELLQDQEFFGKQFLIKDELTSLEWKMGSETKKIGNYTCFKATATKTVDKLDWRSMRPKRKKDTKESKDAEKTIDSTQTKNDNPMGNVEVPNTIEVVAWYTPQIPINQGPDDYWGLPGLILEINADKTTILCTKIVMNPEEKETIKKPEKGEEVTQAEYTEIITKKIQEMREMYGGRRGRGSRGRRN